MNPLLLALIPGETDSEKAVPLAMMAHTLVKGAAGHPADTDEKAREVWEHLAAKAGLDSDENSALNSTNEDQRNRLIAAALEDALQIVRRDLLGQPEQPTLAVVVDSHGAVQEVVSDDPEALRGLRVITVDGDMEPMACLTPTTDIRVKDLAGVTIPE